MSTCAIETTGLYKRFGKQTVLDGIDLTVPAGTIFALLGPNGAGKTTLVNILSTLIRPDDGKALVVGYDVVKQKETVLDRPSRSPTAAPRHLVDVVAYLPHRPPRPAI